jgi:phage gp45-like
MNGIKELAAKLRNVFSLSEYQKRYDDDGKIQVKTHNGKVLEKREAFPYGFYAKAAGGKALVFCQGGNFDSFEILPILKSDEVTPPELGEGDAAVYTGGGGRVVLRDGGDIEITAKAEGKITVDTENGNCEINVMGAGNAIISCADGKVFLGNSQKNMCAAIIGLIDEIKALVMSGAPPTHTVNPATQSKLETYKQQFQAFLLESK